MKKINKLIALLIVCMAMPALAGAQVLKNAYFNVDWQINSPFGQDFSKKTSGWGSSYLLARLSVITSLRKDNSNRMLALS